MSNRTELMAVLVSSKIHSVAGLPGSSYYWVHRNMVVVPKCHDADLEIQNVWPLALSPFH